MISGRALCAALAVTERAYPGWPACSQTVPCRIRLFLSGSTAVPPGRTDYLFGTPSTLPCGTAKLLPPWQSGAAVPHRDGRGRAHPRPALFVLDPGLLSLHPGAYTRQAPPGSRALVAGLLHP